MSRIKEETSFGVETKIICLRGSVSPVSQICMRCLTIFDVTILRIDATHYTSVKIFPVLLETTYLNAHK